MKRFTDSEKALQILKDADFGTLCMLTPEGEPYGIPVNHVYLPGEHCIAIHCARKGKKLDCLRANPRVSFCAVSQAELVPAGYTTHYSCAVATGKAQIVTEQEEMRKVLSCLCARFSPGEPGEAGVIEQYLKNVCIVKIHLDSVTGKRNQGA